ncbi:penicillin acylase family protein [Polaromonas sp. UC242_47]|uniref:penicillin acylase family protein n=1 Tax=Polaromonas sp. UC242_47 TaxID=3374626 RepID=UPI0037B87E80
MVWLKRFFWAILLLLLLLALAVGIYIQRSLPMLDGTLKLSGLASPVTVARDPSDVTHIKAQSPRDAWKAIGYVHAQERGWQLEFNRRVMHGELSEVLGAATLDTDKLMRTLGIMEAAQRQWQILPAEAKEALQAYSEGIQAFYADSTQALSPEFHLLGVKPGGASGQPWTPQDSVGWSLMMALDLGGNWGTEFARLSAAKVLNTAQLWQLFTPYPGEAPASKTDFAKLYAELGIYKATPDAIKTGANKAHPERARGLFDHEQSAKTATLLAQDINDWAANIGNVEGKGSNNWVVDGSRTRSGKPLLANDPHLGLSAPAIWYFARLQAPAGKAADGRPIPGLDVIGATLPGLPFVVLGRTDKVAWGFTNTGPDVQDLYLEQLNPANPLQYRVPGSTDQPQWADFKTRSEIIKVKGQADVGLTVRSSRHGPVLSDAQKSHAEVLDTGKYVLALRWSALDTDNLTVLAGLRANQAQSVDELITAYADHHSPMQNVVMADVAGKVAYKAVGKTPLRKADNDIRGIAPSPGWEARYDWAGWLPYAQTPQVDSEALSRKGWFANANQNVVPPGSDLFMGQDWVVPYRFDRIEKLLAATPQHDLASMQKIQADQLSLATLKLLPFLQKTVSQHPLAREAQAALAGFDGTMRVDSAAPLIFSVWVDELTRGVIGSKLGETRLKSMYGKRHFRGAIEEIVERDDLSWCGAAGCTAQSSAALDRALTVLQARYGAVPAQWTWGQAHFALSAHRPFSNVPVLARLFDVTVPTGGDSFTINVGQYWPNDANIPFANRHAASLRAVYDLSNLENSQFIYQTGQSGLVFSSRYRDMRQTWVDVGYRPLQMKPATFVHELTLTP